MKIQVLAILSAVVGLSQAPHEPLPSAPLLERHESPNGQYAFEVEVIKQNWNSMASSGELLRLDDGPKQWIPYWIKVLPNRFRPKFFLVNNDGYVITFDDMENTMSPHAITIFDPVGNVTLNLSFDALLKILKQELATVINLSKTGFGLWMSGMPSFLGADSNIVVVGTAGGILRISLSDHALTFPFSTSLQ